MYDQFFSKLLNTGIALAPTKFAEAIAKGEHDKKLIEEKSKQVLATEKMKPLAKLVKAAQDNQLDLTNPEQLAVLFEH